MRRRAETSIGDRVAAMRDPAVTPAPPPPTGTSLKHCWVVGEHGRLPALLLGWEQRVDGWHGRVVHPVRDAEGWVVVEEWLPASVLSATGSDSAGG